jgi:hypothetical protein
MNGNNWDRTGYGGGPAAEQPDAWYVDRALLWGWIDELLRGAPVARIDSDMLRALCAQALDTHAPAVLVHAQAAGVLLERLIAAAVARSYADRYGHPNELYDVERLRVVARGLQSGAASAA